MSTNIHAIAEAVAIHLSGMTELSWHPAGNPVWDHMSQIRSGTGEDSPVINLHDTRNGHGNLTIDGDWPRGEHGTTYGPYRDRPSIGVSASKPAEAIAKDIARRFLPEYLTLYAEAVAGKQRDTDSRARGFAVAEALADILGETLGEARQDGWSIHRYNEARGDLSISVQVDPHSDDRRVKVTLDNLTQAEAEAVLRSVQ